MSVFENIYNRTTIFQLHKDVKYRKRARQDDMSVLKLFKLWFESIFQEMKLGKMVVSINEEYLNLLWFADDVILLSKSLDKLQEMLH